MGLIGSITSTTPANAVASASTAVVSRDDMKLPEGATSISVQTVAQPILSRALIPLRVGTALPVECENPVLKAQLENQRRENLVKEARRKRLTDKLGWKREDQYFAVKTAIEGHFVRLMFRLQNIGALTPKGRSLFIALMNKFYDFPFHKEMKIVLSQFRANLSDYATNLVEWNLAVEELSVLEFLCTDLAFAGKVVHEIMPELLGEKIGGMEKEYLTEIKMILNQEVLGIEAVLLMLEDFIHYPTISTTPATDKALCLRIHPCISLIDAQKKLFIVRKKNLHKLVKVFIKQIAKVNKPENIQTYTLSKTLKSLESILDLVMKSHGKITEMIGPLLLALENHLLPEVSKKINEEAFKNTEGLNHTDNLLKLLRSIRAQDETRVEMGKIETVLTSEIDEKQTTKDSEKKHSQQVCEEEKKLRDECRELLNPKNQRIEKDKLAQRVRKLKEKPHDELLQKEIEENYRHYSFVYAQNMILYNAFENLVEVICVVEKRINLTYSIYAKPLSDIDALCHEFDMDEREEDVVTGDDSKREIPDTKEEKDNEDMESKQQTVPTFSATPMTLTVDPKLAKFTTTMQRLSSLVHALEPTGHAIYPKSAKLAFQEAGYHLSILGGTLDLPMTEGYLKHHIFSMVRSCALISEQILTARNLLEGAHVADLPHSHEQLEGKLELLKTFDPNNKERMANYLKNINGGSVAHRYARELDFECQIYNIPPQLTLKWLLGKKKPLYTDLVQLGIDTLAFVELTTKTQPAEAKLSESLAKEIEARKLANPTGVAKKEGSRLKKALASALLDLQTLIENVEEKIKCYKNKENSVLISHQTIAWELVQDHLKGLQEGLKFWIIAPQPRFLASFGDVIWARLQFIDELVGKALHWELYKAGYKGHDLVDLRNLCGWTKKKGKEEALIAQLNVHSGSQLIHHRLFSNKQKNKLNERSLTWRIEALKASFHVDDLDDGMKTVLPKKVNVEHLRKELVDVVTDLLGITVERLQNKNKAN